jgi:hypothetical protein
MLRATVNPVIEMECMKKKKFTTTKKNIGSSGVVSWGEHIFFEPKNVVSIYLHS